MAVSTIWNTIPKFTAMESSVPAMPTATAPTTIPVRRRLLQAFRQAMRSIDIRGS
jgi:hypothetical protein